MERTLKAVGGLLLVVAALAGCDTEQPVATSTQNASLDFASYTLGELIDVWDRHIDPNGNGAQDPAEVDTDEDGILDPGEDTNHNGRFDPQEPLGPLDGFQCGVSYPTPADDDGNPLVPQHPALWGFAAEVKVFHGNALVSTDIIPPSAAQGFGNFPSWQDDPTHYPLVPPTAEENIPFDQPYVFTNQRRMLNTSSDVMSCYLGVLPSTNLAGNPLPFEFTLEPGDTVVVKTGRDLHPPIVAWVNNPKAFDAVLRVNGRVVAPQGITSSSAANGLTSFSYQLR